MGGEMWGELKVRTIGLRNTSGGSDGVYYKERPGLAEGDGYEVQVGRCVSVVGDMTASRVGG